jgi:transcriptional regulator with XRE-family HTH domain
MARRVVDGQISVKIGRRIKEQREAMGLTQSALGKMLGYRYGNFIAMVEGGNSAFPIDKWRDYADQLNIPRHEFLELVMKETYPEMIPYIDGFSDPVERTRAKRAKAEDKEPRK